jgi:hypothetical protein
MTRTIKRRQRRSGSHSRFSSEKKIFVLWFSTGTSPNIHRFSTAEDERWIRSSDDPVIGPIHQLVWCDVAIQIRGLSVACRRNRLTRLTPRTTL